MLGNHFKFRASMYRKGIILAGGSGSRLFPLTRGVCKQLLPVYDKPMIYYPLSVLMLTDIREILIISTPNDLPILERILGDGSEYGVNLHYASQTSPGGLAQAFLIGESFLAGSPSVLVLGDNLLFGQDLTTLLFQAKSRERGATVLAYRVSNPSYFGVVEFDHNNKVLSIEEKPLHPKSSYAVPGLYFYDERACEFAKGLKPSPRGELEITDLNRCYLDSGELFMQLLGRGSAWLDMGTHESLLRAAIYVESVQTIQGYQIANLEEISLRKGWISSEQLHQSLSKRGKSSYNNYLQEILTCPGHESYSACVE